MTFPLDVATRKDIAQWDEPGISLKSEMLQMQSWLWGLDVGILEVEERVSRRTREVVQRAAAASDRSEISSH